MASARSPVEVGQTLSDKYVVERVIGAGAMGVVLAGRHVALDQKVAIKFLLPEHRDDTDLMARFTREARVLAKLQSPHVARVFDVGTIEDGTPFIVMEYLEGSDLAAVIRERGSIPAAQAVTWVREICEAVVEAHAAGVVHRDLKPANVFLAKTRSGRAIVKVLDFGIAKSLGVAGDTLALTQKDGLLGSPLYMAPEQLASSRDVDARTDVWAVGVILYELLTGEPPFMAPTLAGLVAAIQSAAPNAEHLARANVPAEIRSVIDRCLAKDRAERYPTAAELAEALQSLAPTGDPSSRSAPATSGPSPRADSERTDESSTRTSGLETRSETHWTETRDGARRRENAFIVGSVITGAAIVVLLASVYVRRRGAPAIDATSAQTSASEATSAARPIDPVDPLPPATSAAPEVLVPRTVTPSASRPPPPAVVRLGPQGSAAPTTQSAPAASARATATSASAEAPSFRPPPPIQLK